MITPRKHVIKFINQYPRIERIVIHIYIILEQTEKQRAINRHWHIAAPILLAIEDLAIRSASDSSTRVSAISDTYSS